MKWQLLWNRASARPNPVGNVSDVADANEQILASLLVMAWMVEARDPYTGGHLWRVARYAALLCEAARLPADACASIAIGGFLHDLGKVGVPDAILRKPGKLDDAETAVMRTHPEVGMRMLSGHPLAELVSAVVLLHHERPDGRGYPHGLAGDAIPVGAAVVGLCDAFDAMTSTRPYRAGMPISQALSIIESELDRQFDGPLGRQFIALGRKGLLDHVAGHSDDGIPLQRCLMCGPTLVVRREHASGDSVFCRSCGGAYRLEAGADGALLGAVATGGRGSARELEPEPDTALIGRFVRETARLAIAAGAQAPARR
ncbi:MAG: HD-GYP domain-containing protein [Burkholderiales bacterium]|nr:HD-GYP domain-containing protein [Burkholderiales bacterium]MDE2275494.1 HD-GYP domain-containing protein [Burkholderiales bacterium]